MILKVELAEFVENCMDKNSNYSTLPVPLAAEYLSVSPAYISQLVAKGKLDLIKITSGDNTRQAVLVTSLYELKNGEDKATEERVARLTKFLVKVGRKGNLVTYGEAMEAIGLKWSNPNHRAIFSKILYDVTYGHDLFKNGILITALVVYKRNKRPNQNFFEIAQEEELWDHEEVSQEDFHDLHVNTIYQFFKKQNDD